jgi:hypothetical protein
MYVSEETMSNSEVVGKAACYKIIIAQKVMWLFSIKNMYDSIKHTVTSIDLVLSFVELPSVALSLLRP